MGAVLLTGVLLLSGCTPGGEAETPPPPTPTPVETQPAPSSEEPTAAPTAEDLGLTQEEMDLIKYNLYVEMNNEIVELLESLYNYYEVVEYADEFAFVPDTPYSYQYGISSFDSDLVDDALLAAEMEPAYETLDELTVRIAEPMRALMDTFRDISRCYDFADDQYAKPREFHKVIQANAADFEETAYLYMDALSEVAAERTMAEEQRMLSEGRVINYYSSHVITVTRALLEECYAQGVYDDNIQELDLTPIRPLYEELTAAAEAYDTAVQDKNQLMAESLSASPMYSMEKLVQAVDWMIRQVESGAPIEDPGREYLGGIIHIEEVLSSCIDDYNRGFVE